MATSGSSVFKVTDWDDLWFTWTLSSQSTANNTSTIAWKMQLISTNYGDIYSNTQKEWDVYVNGVHYSGLNYVSINHNETKTLASGTTVIEHNDDGTKTFSYSFRQEFSITFSDVYIGNIRGSGSDILPTIARASQPSCVTWPEHTQNVGEFGDEISIHMNRKSSEFTHTVRYQFGTQSGTIATGVGTGTTWVIPLTLMNLIPNTTKGSGTIYVDTYDGDTKIGTKSCGFTATVPASIKPSCTITVSDATENLTTYGSYVKGLSRFKVTITPTLAYKSAIKTYSTTANGGEYTTASFTTGALSGSGTLKISTTVVDNRGRSASASKSLTVLNYSAPSVTKLTVGRCDADGTANEQGEYVQVTFSAAVTALNNKNTASYTLKYKKSTESTFTEVTFSAIKNVYSVTDHKYIFEADTGSSYDVEVSVVDNHGTSSRTTSASTAFTLMHWKADGTGIGIGKVSEKSNTMEVGLDAEFYGSTMKAGNSYSYQPGAFNGEKGYTLLAVVTLNALNVNAPIVFKINRRGALCPMQVYVRFASSSTTTDPDLGSITYEGDNFGAFLVKSAASTWKLYVDNTTGWSNPCLQEWFTTDNQMSRMSIVFPSEQIVELPEPYYRATPAKMQSLLDYIYPVGSIYISYSHVNPSTLFGGTWVRIENAFLWGCDENGGIGTTGGEKTHTLTVNELPTHNHGGTYTNAGDTTKTHAWLASGGSAMAYDSVDAGAGQPHNNMPPYVQVSIWRRTE